MDIKVNIFYNTSISAVGKNGILFYSILQNVCLLLKIV